MKRRILSLCLTLCLLASAMPALAAAAVSYPTLTHDPVHGFIYADGYAVTFREGTTAGQANVFLNEDLNTPLCIQFEKVPTEAGYDLGWDDIYGSPLSQKAERVSITMEGGELLSLIGSAREGVSGDIRLTATGGKLGRVTGTYSNTSVGGGIYITLGGNVHITGSVSVKQSWSPAPAGGAHIYLSGAPTIGGGQSGIMINGGTENYGDGVDHVEITGVLNGGNESISLYLPKGYAGGTLATGAASAGDAKKFRLVGPGADTYAPYYKDGKIVTGPALSVQFYVDGRVYSVQWTAPGGTVRCPADPIVPSKTRTFLHWSLTENGGPYDFAAPVAEDLNLYAVWREPVLPSSVTLNKNTLALTYGGSDSLTASLLPENADNQNLLWYSSNSNVAAVANGVVNAKGAGTATITVKAAAAPATVLDTCAVTVEKAARTDAPAGLRGVQPTAPGAADGAILGLDPSQPYEWRVEGVSEYTALGNGADRISGLSSGAYEVRMAEDGNHLASPAAQVTLPAYSDQFIPVASLTDGPGKASTMQACFLTAGILPVEATCKEIIWSVKDAGTTGAEITGNRLNTIAGGEVIITATVTGGLGEGQDYAQDFHVQVTDIRPAVEEVNLSTNNLNLTAGNSFSLTAHVLPAAAMQKVRWSSDNPAVAVVDENAVITAVAPGTATITVASVAEPAKTATCVVTVKARNIPVTGVSLNKSSLTLTTGGSETLLATVSPENATNKNVRWTTSDSTVATVENGVVTAMAPGEAKISVCSEDGSLTAECLVTVNAPVQPQYTVTFMADGIVVDTRKVIAGGALGAAEFPGVPEKTGYAGKWDTNGEIVNVTKDLTVTAVYTAQKYEVTFDANGGEPLAEHTITVVYDAAYGPLPTPAHATAGMSFAGWYTQAVGGLQVNAESKVATAEDHILFAHWSDGGDSAVPVVIVSGMPGQVTLPYHGAGIALSVEEASTYSYQWAKNGGDISGATASSYTIPASDVTWVNHGAEYTCTVTNAEDGKRPVSATGAAVTLSVQKGTQEMPVSLSGVAPSSFDGFDGKIIGLKAGHSYEYKRADGGAYTGAGSLCVEITGLSAGTYLVRLAGDDSYHPSPDAAVLVPSYSAPTVPVTGITLNKSSLALTVGGSETLTATVFPPNATNKNVCWTTGDSSVATVENGVVTAKAVGRTTITAASAESDKTAVCTVTVNAAPTEVRNILSVSKTVPIAVDHGTTEAQVMAKLPSGVEITLDDGSRQTAGVKWLCETSFDGNQSGDYIFKGTLAAASGIANPNGLQAEIIVTVKPETAPPVNPDPPGGGGGGGGGGGITPTPPVVNKNPDGSVTTTIADERSGTVTKTTEYPDGTKIVALTPKDGETSIEITIAKKADKVSITIPTPVPPKPGEVAVVIHDDGTREILKTSVPTGNGLRISLEEGGRLELIDNTKNFGDVAEDAWYADAVTFVTSREIFHGANANTFQPQENASRAMLFTVLARLDGQNTAGGGKWYQAGMDWAVEAGISDGSNPNGEITREQLAVMFYRYAGSPEAGVADLDDFDDNANVSGWAGDAMLWAVEAGILEGNAGKLSPDKTATRAEVAVMLQRFIELLVK